MFMINTVKTVLSGHSKRTLDFNTDPRLMQVKGIAEWSKEHSAILSTYTKLPLTIKTFVLSILSGRLGQVLLYSNVTLKFVAYIFFLQLVLGVHFWSLRGGVGLLIFEIWKLLSQNNLLAFVSGSIFPLSIPYSTGPTLEYCNRCGFMSSFRSELSSTLTNWAPDQLRTIWSAAYMNRFHVRGLEIFCYDSYFKFWIIFNRIDLFYGVIML